MKKAFPLVFLIVPAILIANFASVMSNKSSNPIISWTPKIIEEKIFPGDTSEINVVFESKKDLQDIELWLTPGLKDFITFTPGYFDNVSTNAKNFVHLEISVPAETLLGTYDGTLHVRAGNRTFPQTLKITLEIIEPLSEENLTTMLETHKEAAQNFNEWLEIYGREEARQMTVNWLRIQTNIQETGISDDGTIWIVFTNGIGGDITTYPLGTLGGNKENNLIFPGSIQKIVNKINVAVFSGLVSNSLIASNQPTVVGNDKVIVLDPFLDELGGISPQSDVYSRISPLTDATYFKNEEVTVDIIKEFYEYGVVDITTHGRLHRDSVGFLSGEKVTPINIFFHIGDLRNKRLSIGWHGLTPYYEILPAFIMNYTEEPYSDSLIYIGACQSLKNLTMANAFLERGSATYFGFTRTASSLFNKEKTEELFTNLVDKRQATGEAFTNGLDPYWPGPDPEYGYESEPAKFDMVGESNLALLLKPKPVISPWPMFHHDMRHTGQSEYIGAQIGNLKWKYRTGKDIYSSPAIDSDGTIYIGSYDGYIYAINPDGTLKWKYATGRSIYSSSPAIGSSGTIYIGSFDGYLYAINRDGTLKWKYMTGSRIYSSPTIDVGGIIYVGAIDYLYAINPDGALEWRYKTIEDIYSSPAISEDGTIYVSTEYGYLFAINSDGALKWKSKVGFTPYSSPVISEDGTIYVGSQDYYLYAFNSDGSLKWKYKTESAINSSPGISSDGIIYIGSNDRYLYAINPNGTLKWKHYTGKRISASSPAIGLDGTIYIGSSADYFYAINPDGTLKWKYTSYGYEFYSSPAIGTDGTIYVGAFWYYRPYYKGYLYAFGE